MAEPGAQGMINVARGDAQSIAIKPNAPSRQNEINQDQATSDRLSSPNHRLQVTKAHPTTYGITTTRALPTGSE